MGVLLFTALVGCSPQEDTTVASGQETVEEVEEKIVIEVFPDLFPEYMMESIEAAGLGDKVEFREIPQNQYENKVRMMIAGGEVGDLICIDAPNIAYYANMGALEPLDSYWDESDFDDLVGSSKSAMQWQDQI
jgi:ABC-type glycerol-3-phosphate transport system substrate-binding protein